jgi:H+/gluconate symporter-like permease
MENLKMEYLYVCIGVLVALNILVSIFIFKCEDLEKFQKVAQIIVVWLIPFLGAIVLLLFHRSQRVSSKQSKSVHIKASHDYTTGTD